MLQTWTRKVWPYAFYALGLANLIVTIAGWRGWGWDHRLIGIAFLLLALHVSEEWFLPGGFHVQYNTLMGSDQVDHYPMDRLTDSTTVVVAIALGLVFIPVGGTVLVLAMMTFALLEVLMHAVMGTHMHGVLKTDGKRTIYGPGTLTAYLLYLPLAVIIAVHVAGTGAGAGTWVLGVLTGIAYAGATAFVPEMAMRSRNSKHPYTDPGYFRRYPAAVRNAIYPSQGR